MQAIDFLPEYRKNRNFNVETYVEDKVNALNTFFKDNNLNSVVLGISGGIDSAVVLYLLDRVKKIKDSSLKLILPLSLPIKDSEGVTNQDKVARMALDVINSLNYNYHEINLHDAYHAIIDSSIKIAETHPDRKWAEGQMASVLRTPVLYYHAAILQAGGNRSIVCGTTNRDEGAYIGFFGKASDAMVDLQPIGDIHKSEVYQVAEYLGVPYHVIEATPKGDVWDGKNDQEMIGATYDEIELFLLMKEQLGSVDSMLMQELQGFKNIEKLHKINEHKYQVGNPAHFVDVMNRKVKGGW
jgi:NAD+ synthetase